MVLVWWSQLTNMFWGDGLKPPPGSAHTHTHIFQLAIAWEYAYTTYSGLGICLGFTDPSWCIQASHERSLPLPFWLLRNESESRSVCVLKPQKNTSRTCGVSINFLPSTAWNSRNLDWIKPHGSSGWCVLNPRTRGVDPTWIHPGSIGRTLRGGTPLFCLLPNYICSHQKRVSSPSHHVFYFLNLFYLLFVLKF